MILLRKIHFKCRNCFTRFTGKIYREKNYCPFPFPKKRKTLISSIRVKYVLVLKSCLSPAPKPFTYYIDMSVSKPVLVGTPETTANFDETFF